MRLPPSTAKLLTALSSGLLCISCMRQIALNTQSEIMEQASPEIEKQTDFETARAGIPGTLMQVDGLLAVDPDNEKLLFLGTKGWGSYAYGFVEDEMEQAELDGDLERADQVRARARSMYLKAKELGFRLLEQMAPDFRGAVERDPDVLRAFVEEHFTDAEDVPALFWTGYAWGSAINVSRDDPALIADLRFPPVLIERAVALDETYYNAAGHVFLGVFHSSLGKSVGGDPAKGKRHFDKALALAERRALVAQFNYAQSYAVQSQDRELFVSLLEEVANAEIPEGSPLGLPNTVAKRRAARLLEQVDTLILEPLPPLEDTPPPVEPVPPTPDGPPAATAPNAATAPTSPATTAAPKSSDPAPAVAPAPTSTAAPPPEAPQAAP